MNTCVLEKYPYQLNLTHLRWELSENHFQFRSQFRLCCEHIHRQRSRQKGDLLLRLSRQFPFASLASGFYSCKACVSIVRKDSPRVVVNCCHQSISRGVCLRQWHRNLFTFRSLLFVIFQDKLNCINTGKCQYGINCYPSWIVIV